MKDIYTDSRGIEHFIDDMPRIMVFHTVVKYGKVKLLEDGYEKLVTRFENIVKNAEVVKAINEMEVR